MTSREHRLNVYSLCVANIKQPVKASALRTQAETLGLSSIVASINRLADNGIRYSGEDFDVLAAAHHAIETARFDDSELPQRARKMWA